MCSVLRSIAGTEMTSEALAALVMKDAPYYARYGGGVTFSTHSFTDWLHET